MPGTPRPRPWSASISQKFFQPGHAGESLCGKTLPQHPTESPRCQPKREGPIWVKPTFRHSLFTINNYSSFRRWTRGQDRLIAQRSSAVRTIHIVRAHQALTLRTTRAQLVVAAGAEVESRLHDVPTLRAGTPQ